MSSTFNAGIKQAYEKPYGFISASSMLPGIQSTQATQATRLPRLPRLHVSVYLRLNSSITCIKSDFI